MTTHALVDADSIVYGVGFSTEDASESVAASEMAKFMEKMIYVENDCETYDMWITGKTNFRNEIAVTQPYKGQRTGKKPKHYDFLRDYLVKGWDAKVSEGEEADDCVSIAAYASDPEHYLICSLDKDLDNVRGWHYCWRGKKKGRYYVTEEQALLNFYKQILTGDRIDSIQGIHGIGPVKADKILRGCVTPEDYYRECVKAYGGNTSRVIENARLLWLRRQVGEIWQPPMGVQDDTGTV